jgi:predicted TIM-barrel fold metal-dependent hydrolase
MKDGFRVIDADGHMMEPVDIWDRYVDKDFHDRRPIAHRTAYSDPSGGHWYEVSEGFPHGFPPNKVRPAPDPSQIADSRARFGDAFDNGFPLDARLRHMDEDGIDTMVCFRSWGVIATWPTIGDPALQAALCRAYNNWATDYCADSSGRVRFVAEVPTVDIDEACREVKRLRNRKEIIAVSLSNPMADIDWSESTYDPLWEALVDADLAAAVHGGIAQSTILLPWVQRGPMQHIIAHAISFPFEAQLSMASLILGGALERFPHLRVGFYEANAGWLPWWLSRLDEHIEGRHNTMSQTRLRMLPSEYFARQCAVACDSDEGALVAAVDAMAGANIVFNSDYPHPDSAFPGSVATLLERDISDEAKRAILWDNSIVLYGDRLKASSR